MGTMTTPGGSMTPAEAARAILAKQWDGTIPVDPVKISKSLGVSVFAAPSLGVSGDFRELEGKPVIRINSTEPVKRQRFTAAHELGHYVLKHGANFRDPTQNFSLDYFVPEEVEANRFAAELLMPSDAVRYVFENEKFSGLTGIADKFNVSHIAMKLKLIELGYL